MKYLLIAISILAALLLGLLIAPLLTPRPVAEEGSLVVNQRIYSPQELAERIRTTPYHFENKNDLITDLIYRELLLQEAKQQKIDAEVKFRRSMRDFYEQSMIKTLLDRQYGQNIHQPNPAQIADCVPFLSRTFQLKLFSYPDYASARQQENARVSNYNQSYLELPEDTRSALFDLNGGQLSDPMHSGNGWFRLQLVGISARDDQSIPSAVEQEELCREELRRQSIQGWVEGLFQKSNIEMPKLSKEGNNG